MAGIGCDKVSYGGMCGVTYLDYTYTCEMSGTITSWCINVTTASTVKLKVFRRVTWSDGSVYINFIGESPSVNVTAGTTSGLPCGVSVNKGDMLATYCSSGSSGQVGTGTTQTGWAQSGDIQSNTLLGNWTASIQKNVPAVSASINAIQLAITVPNVKYNTNTSGYYISISVNPYGINTNDVALNLHYDPTMIVVTSAAPGNFLRQNGAPFSFIPPVVDGTNGVVSMHGSTVDLNCVAGGTCCNYQNPPAVTTIGTFAIVYFNTLQKLGTVQFTLDNVNIGYCYQQYQSGVGNCNSYICNYTFTYIYNNNLTITCPDLLASMSIQQ